MKKIQNLLFYVRTMYIVIHIFPSFIILFFFLGRGEGVIGELGMPLSINTARQNYWQNYAYFPWTEHVQQCKGNMIVYHFESWKFLFKNLWLNLPLFIYCENSFPKICFFYRCCRRYGHALYLQGAHCIGWDDFSSNKTEIA